jgi:hypothetical protein
MRLEDQEMDARRHTQSRVKLCRERGIGMEAVGN